MKARSGVAACSAAVVLGLSRALHLGRSNCSDDDLVADEHLRLGEPKFLPWAYASCLAPSPPEVYDLRKPLWARYTVADPGTKCSDPYDFSVYAGGGYGHTKEAECTSGVTSMELSVFWSVGPGGLSDDVVREQLSALDASGLGAQAKTVKVAARDHYGESSWRGRFQSDFIGNNSEYSWASKVEDVRISVPEDESWWAEQERHWEFYALEGLWDHCMASQTPSSEAVLYMHTKGGTHPGARALPDMSGTKRADWRRLLQHFSITRYQDCVDHLKCGYSTCGPLLASPDKPRVHWPHYSGNVWWARCDYIRALPRPRPLSRELTSRDLGDHAPTLDPPLGRYKAEWWLLGSLRDYSRNRHFKNCWGATGADWKTVSGCKDCWKCWISWDEVARKDARC